MIAPRISISRIAGRAMLATRAPSDIDALKYSDTISRAIEDIGASAQPVQIAWRQLVPLPRLASDTPRTCATPRVTTSAATRPTTEGFHSALAATTATSTNISMVSSVAAVPSWRGQLQGRGCSCFSSSPPTRPASGAEPPKCAATAVPAETSAIITIEVFSLVGLMKRSAERSTSAISAPTMKDTPSTTATG